MQKIKKFFVLALLVTMIGNLSLISSGLEDIKEVPFNDQPGVKVEVLKSDVAHTMASYTIAGFNKEKVDIDGKTYYKISLPNEGISMEKSAPELPSISRSIIIPDASEMEVKILEAKYTDYKMPIVPSKGDLTRDMEISKIPYSFGKAYYNDGFAPSKLVELGEPYIFRDYRGIVVKLNAFQYNPATEVLRVYDNVVIDVVESGKSDRNVIYRERIDKNLIQNFASIYEKKFINYEKIQIDLVSLEEILYGSERGSMLIICHDDFYNAMDPFVKWKNSKGIPTEIVKMSAVSPKNNANEIKNYIQNYYNSNRGLTYLLLVGDMAQVASPIVGSDASDATYSKLSGTDNYPEIFVGRFSAESAEDVATQVDRSISYERDTATGSIWLKNGTGIASAEGYNESDREHMDYIRNDLLGFTYNQVDRIYDPRASAASVISAVNEGRSFINYCGHGSSTSWITTGFNSANVAALNNEGRLPFIYSVACVNGTFHKGTCFAERWLRSRNSSGQPIGAVGAYMSTINQPWVPPMIAQDEATDLITGKSRVTLGGICYSSAMKMLDSFGATGANTFDHWVLFGDPSLQLRTDNPQTITTNNIRFITYNTTEINVTTDAPRALCALSKDGVLYGYDYADGRGEAKIKLTRPLPSRGSMTLTITGFNRETKIQSISILPRIIIDIPIKEYVNLKDIINIKDPILSKGISQ